MYNKLTDDELNALISQVNHMEDVFRIIRTLERKFDFVSALVTRSDVEDEFGEAWEYEGDARREMTYDQWYRFSNDWFWTTGHLDIMWDGVPNAIRWELRELGFLPKEAVVE